MFREILKARPLKRTVDWNLWLRRLMTTRQTSVSCPPLFQGNQYFQTLDLLKLSTQWECLYTTEQYNNNDDVECHYYKHLYVMLISLINIQKSNAAVFKCIMVLCRHLFLCVQFCDLSSANVFLSLTDWLINWLEST